MKADALRELRRALLPCPHCAGPARLEWVGGATSCRMRCESYQCGATTKPASDEAEALALWNRRGGKQ